MKGKHLYDDIQSNVYFCLPWECGRCVQGNSSPKLYAKYGHSDMPIIVGSRTVGRGLHACILHRGKCSVSQEKVQQRTVVGEQSAFLPGIAGHFPVQQYVVTAVEFCTISFIIMYLSAADTCYSYLHTELC